MPRQGAVSTFHCVNPSDVSTQSGALTQLPAISNYFPLSVFCDRRNKLLNDCSICCGRKEHTVDS